MAEMQSEFDERRRLFQTTKSDEVSATPLPLDPDRIRGIVFDWFSRQEKIDELQDEKLASELQPVALKELIEDAKSDQAEALEQSRSVYFTPSKRPQKSEYFNTPKNPKRSKLAYPRRPWVSSVVVEICEHEGIRLDESADSYPLLYKLVGKALAELRDRTIDRLEGRRFKIHDREFTDDRIAAHAKPSAESIYFGDLVESYIKERETDNLRPTTIDEYRVAARLFIGFLGEDRPIDRISRKDFVGFRDSLRNTPANAAKLYPNKSFQQIASMQHSRTRTMLSGRTINKQLEKISGLLTYAENSGWISKNLSKRIRVKTGDRPPRRSFTNEQLVRMFSAPLFTGCVNDRHGYKKAGANHPRRSRFWVPLVALFSGMRLNEICQLHIEDVKKERSIWYLDVRENLEDGQKALNKNLKTKASLRKVPVHPKLIEIGFVSYATQLRSCGEDRLFPELKTASRGSYSDHFQKWFSRFLTSIKVKAPGYSFHSFRHLFNDRLKAAGVDVRIAKRLCGWSEGDDMAAHYGEGFGISQLHSEISKVSYPELNLDHLRQD